MLADHHAWSWLQCCLNMVSQRWWIGQAINQPANCQRSRDGGLNQAAATSDVHWFLVCPKSLLCDQASASHERAMSQPSTRHHSPTRTSYRNNQKPTMWLANSVPTSPIYTDHTGWTSCLAVHGQMSSIDVLSVIVLSKDDSSQPDLSGLASGRSETLSASGWLIANLSSEWHWWTRNSMVCLDLTPMCWSYRWESFLVAVCCSLRH